MQKLFVRREGVGGSVSPSPGVVTDGGVGAGGWLCSVALLSCAAYPGPVPLPACDHWPLYPHTRHTQYWDYILHLRSVINVIICKLLPKIIGMDPCYCNIGCWSKGSNLDIFRMDCDDCDDKTGHICNKMLPVSQDWGWTVGQVVISQIISNIHPRQH